MMRRLLFILLFIPTVLCGQDMWFVSPAPTGNDSSGDGSSEAPWATISKAFSESTAGDVVYMTAGTYTISSQVTLPTGVSLHGIGTVRIEATSYSVIIDNVHIWNNVISGDGANYGICWNFDGTTSNCSVINNIILDFNLYPILLRQQPSQTTYFNDSEIIYNCFYGNGTDEIAVSGTINQSGNDLSTGNITLNPLLTSSLALSSISSPAYHTGISVGLSTDYEGKAWNNPPSMGAIELIDDTEPPEPPVVVWKRARKGGRYITKQGKYVMMRE
jgi:hypothetical protein